MCREQRQNLMETQCNGHKGFLALRVMLRKGPRGNSTAGTMAKSPKNLDSSQDSPLWFIKGDVDSRMK